MKFVLVFAFCCALIYMPGFSDEITIAQLSKKIEQLENRIAILESLISDQSKISSEKMSTIPADKKIWRKLKKGMSPDDVRKLLGEPLTISSGGITSWYYSENHIHSNVIFTDRDGVRGWDEPE